MANKGEIFHARSWYVVIDIQDGVGKGVQRGFSTRRGSYSPKQPRNTRPMSHWRTVRRAKLLANWHMKRKVFVEPLSEASPHDAYPSPTTFLGRRKAEKGRANFRQRHALPDAFCLSSPDVHFPPSISQVLARSMLVCYAY
jgi:hypothetical protein